MVYKCTVLYNLSIDIVACTNSHVLDTYTTRIPVIRIVAQLAALTALFNEQLTLCENWAQFYELYKMIRLV